MHHRPPRLFDKLRTDCADVGVRVLMVQRRVQSNFTQQTPEQVIASLNRDTNPSQPLADVFNKAAVHQNLADIQAITSAIGAVSAEYKGWATVDARIAQLTAEVTT